MSVRPRRVVSTTFGPLEVDDTAGAPTHPPQTTTITDHQEDIDHGQHNEDQDDDEHTGRAGD